MFSNKTDRKREGQKILELQKFVEMYGDRPEDSFFDDFWTGGQTELSIEKNKRIWTWRSSQTKLNPNEMAWKGGSVPSAEPNDCASMSVDGEKGDPSLSSFIPAVLHAGAVLVILCLSLQKLLLKIDYI